MVRKKVVAVAPYERNGIVNFKTLPYEAWRNIGGEVAPVRYPSCKKIVGFFHKYELPSLLGKSTKEARLRFMEPINRKFDAFPDYVRYEIIPMVWDCWPCLDDRMSLWLDRHDVKTAIFTSRQNAERIQRRFPKMNILVITEGIDVAKYQEGKLLKDRSVDLLEFGRTNRLVVCKESLMGIKRLCTGELKKRLTDEELADAMADAKVTIALTKNYTDPAIGAGVETLTQRYWENMLSRIVMVGHAPQELVDLIGYNPVIEVPVDEDSNTNYARKIKEVLEHIEDYQDWVDKNRKVALEMAPWEIRMKTVKGWLESLGYQVGQL